MRTSLAHAGAQRVAKVAKSPKSGSRLPLPAVKVQLREFRKLRASELHNEMSKIYSYSAAFHAAPFQVAMPTCKYVGGVTCTNSTWTDGKEKKRKKQAKLEKKTKTNHCSATVLKISLAFVRCIITTEEHTSVSFISGSDVRLAH